MGKEIRTFGYIKVEKHKFHHCKNLILLEDVDTEKNTGIEYAFLR